MNISSQSQRKFKVQHPLNNVSIKVICKPGRANCVKSAQCFYGKLNRIAKLPTFLTLIGLIHA